MYPICASKEMHISIHFAAVVRNEWNAVFEVILYRFHVVFFTGTSNRIGNDMDAGSVLMSPGKASRE